MAVPSAGFTFAAPLSSTGAVSVPLASCAVTATLPSVGVGTPITLPSGSRNSASLSALTMPSRRAAASRLPMLDASTSWLSRSCRWLSSAAFCFSRSAIRNEFSFVFVLIRRMPSTPTTTTPSTAATNGARGALIGAGGATRSHGVLGESVAVDVSAGTSRSIRSAAVPSTGASTTRSARRRLPAGLVVSPRPDGA